MLAHDAAPNRHRIFGQLGQSIYKAGQGMAIIPAGFAMPTILAKPAQPSPRAITQYCPFRASPYGHGADFAGTIVLEEASEERGDYMFCPNCGAAVREGA